MKQAIYFIETSNGEILYKEDTFWSKGSDVKQAKVHSDSDEDKERFFKSLCTSIKPYNIEKQKEFFKIRQEKYKNSKYGYQIVNSNKNITYIMDDENYNLEAPIYLKIILSIDDDYSINSTDFTPYNREIKLTKLGI